MTWDSAIDAERRQRWLIADVRPRLDDLVWVRYDGTEEWVRCYFREEKSPGVYGLYFELVTGQRMQGWPVEWSRSLRAPE